MRVLGLDPGLRFTGWGVVDSSSGSFSGSSSDVLACVGYGVIAIPVQASLSKRLSRLFTELQRIVETYTIDQVAIEEVFVNMNAESSMKLCMARGVAMVVPALSKIDIFEYATNHIKKTITGRGHASKEEVQRMIRVLLPNLKEVSFEKTDCTDALAAALCHIQHGLEGLGMGRAF